MRVGKCKTNRILACTKDCKHGPANDFWHHGFQSDSPTTLSSLLSHQWPATMAMWKNMFHMTSQSVGLLDNFSHIPSTLPIGSMYAIYGNIYHQYTPNVSIYTIHGSYGLYSSFLKQYHVLFREKKRRRFGYRMLGRFIQTPNQPISKTRTSRKYRITLIDLFSIVIPSIIPSINPYLNHIPVCSMDVIFTYIWAWSIWESSPYDPSRSQSLPSGRPTWSTWGGYLGFDPSLASPLRQNTGWQRKTMGVFPSLKCWEFSWVISQ